MSEIEEIERIQTEYFQKSTFFLYPLLKIPNELKPINTYISWKQTKPKDCTLFCLFEKIVDYKLNQLEKEHLLKNPHLLQLYQSDKYLLYEFDMSDYANNWTMFLEGNYSRFSKYAKQLILRYHKNNPQLYKYAHCYLNPSLYYETYSRILEVDSELFYEGTELIRPPDLEKETLKTSIKLTGISTK